NPEKHAARHGTLLCGAVDNHLARAELAKVNSIWIEAGNERSYGSVSIGNSADRNQLLRAINSAKNERYDLLPNAALLFPELLEAPAPQEEAPAPADSCAALVERADQRLLVNDFMAAIAAEYTFKALNRMPITSFLTYVDIDVLSMRSIPICREELLARLN